MADTAYPWLFNSFSFFLGFLTLYRYQRKIRFERWVSCPPIFSLLDLIIMQFAERITVLKVDMKGWMAK
jgi:hypothetical protein